MLLTSNYQSIISQMVGFCNFTLTFFTPVYHFYTPLKTSGFVTFSGGIEMRHWREKGQYKNEILSSTWLSGFYAGQWKDGYRHGYGMRVNTPDIELNDGATAVKKFLQNASTHISFSRPNSIYEEIGNLVESPQKVQPSPQKIRKSFSSPSKLSSKKKPDVHILSTLTESNTSSSSSVNSRYE